MTDWPKIGLRADCDVGFFLFSLLLLEDLREESGGRGKGCSFEALMSFICVMIGTDVLLMVVRFLGIFQDL